MPAPFSFRDRVPEMAGGRDGVLATVRDMLATTHRIGKAGDASKIPLQKVRDYVVATIQDAVKVRLREPLTQAIEAHLEAVGEEYELLEGECPELPDVDEDGAVVLEEAAEQAFWHRGLLAAIHESLQGDCAVMLGGAKLRELVFREESIQDLADALLAVPVADEDRALHLLGVTREDVETLVAEVHEQKPVSSQIQAELDAELEELMGDCDVHFTAHNQVAIPVEATERLSGNYIEAESKFLVSDTGYAGPAACQLVGEPLSPSAKPKRAESIEHDDLPRAAQAVLEALYERLAEHELAEKIGMSRPQVNNYRNGKTAWHPTSEQADALARLLTDRIEKLTRAKRAFEASLL